MGGLWLYLNLIWAVVVIVVAREVGAYHRAKIKARTEGGSPGTRHSVRPGSPRDHG